jgi:hypothetical protein
MFARRDLGRNLCEVQAHRLDIAPRQRQTDGSARLGTDRPEDVGGRRTLVLWRRGACATPRPTPGDLVLLANSGIVGEPDFYAAASDTLRAQLRLGARADTVSPDIGLLCYLSVMSLVNATAQPYRVA